MAHLFAGRPRAALEAANRSEACLRALPLTQLRLYPVMGLIASALLDLGRLREARQRWSSFEHEARLHGDLMTAMWIHAHPAQFALLFADEERGRAQAILDAHARVRASHPRYRGLAWAHAAIRIEHALYFEEGANAMELVRREQQTLFRSGYPMATQAARLIRARARLAAAAALPRGLSRVRLLLGASADARALRRHGRAVNDGAALLIEAGVAHLLGRRDRALAKLSASVARFSAAELDLFAASADYCAGALEGGDAGRARREAAARVLADEGVREPAHWAAWNACGFRELLVEPV